MAATHRTRIAIVGSGIAGLTCAHLLDPHYEVVLFERETRLGGHTNTIDVIDPVAGALSVDTGFIVHNDRNYPNFVQLLAELGVATRPTRMSFGVTDRDTDSPTEGFTYRATNLNTLFADRRNITNRAMWRMLADIVQFYAKARVFLRQPDPTMTLNQFLASGRYSREFLELHLIPMGASVWSADPSNFGEYPAQSLFSFLSNHGLLGVGRRPQWRTIVGGSRTYVSAIAQRLTGEVRLSAHVSSISRTMDGRVEVTTSTGTETFDKAIIAVHSDQALAMLADASTSEKEVLGDTRYQPNRATLHTDTSLLPRRRRAWAAWNYDRRGPNRDAATLTYDMTALQGLAGARRYLVSLNCDEYIDPSTIIASIDYSHPIFDGPAIAAQARFDEIDGRNGLHFCGAWWGYGFHEDGVNSALRVCRRLGVNWRAGQR